MGGFFEFIKITSTQKCNKAAALITMIIFAAAFFIFSFSYISKYTVDDNTNLNILSGNL